MTLEGLVHSGIRFMKFDSNTKICDVILITCIIFLRFRGPNQLPPTLNQWRIIRPRGDW